MSEEYGSDVWFYQEGVFNNFDLNNPQKAKLTLNISTQEQFVHLVATSDWFGAYRINFIGAGFLYWYGIVIPQSVHHINGIGENLTTYSPFAEIPPEGDEFRFLPFIISSLQYETFPEGDDYSISNIKLSTSSAFAFRNLKNISNCHLMVGDGSDCFVNCENIKDCTGTARFGVAFRNCKNITNCQAFGSYSSFSNCENLISCFGKSGSDAVFSDCSMLLNCHAENSALNAPYKDISIASNCQASGNENRTTDWAGTNTHIDPVTCNING